MRLSFTILISIIFASCTAQSKSSTGLLRGTVEIGPLCPQEPCNPTPERLKQVYDAHEIVLMDTSSKKVLFKISIQQNASFNMKVPPGTYLARIKPTTGEGFRIEPIKISIRKGKTTEIHLTYDTGMR